MLKFGTFHIPVKSVDFQQSSKETKKKWTKIKALWWVTEGKN